MNAKDTKTLLKDIRESIKNEKYGDAIHKCQRLLKADPKNYMAYLLLGAAYQNNDKTEAAKFLRKAIEYCTAGPPTVALQGLANCAPIEELPEVYAQLLECVPEKCADYYEKIYALSSNDLLSLKCLNLFKKCAVNDPAALLYLAKIWYASDGSIEADENELYKNAMEVLIQNSTREQQNAVYKRYLKWLYKQKDYAALVRNACNMIVEHANDMYAYEWICKIYCENFQNNENNAWRAELKEPIETYTDALLRLNQNSSLALLIKSFDLYNQQQFVAARQMLRRVLQVQPNYEVALELLARVEMELGAYKMALMTWKQLRRLTQEYAECLSYESESEQLMEAVGILENLQCNEAVVKCLARCYFKLGETTKLQALNLDKLSKAEFAMSTKDALVYLSADDAANSFDGLLLLGKLNLDLKKYDEALNCILRATRLKPHYSKCFEYLGYIYMKLGDTVRGRKCYEKCVNLNELNERAVNDLSDIYQQLGEEELNEALLLNTLGYLNNTSSVRIHYKLGLHYMQVKKWDNAIQSFRTAIKHDVNSMIYWESLGDAYVARGSYNSAVRVFQKIIEMMPDNIYAKLQIALIKTTIRMYPEAIADFDALLRDYPDYLPGLKGAAEAHLGIASNLKADNLYGRAKDHLQLAVNFLQTAILRGNANQMVWLWRLTASVFLQTAQFPTSLANLDVSGSLAKREEAVAFLTRRDLLLLATRFYTCALKLKQNTYLWYELALCCYNCAIYMPDEEQYHLELAVDACKMAIKMQSNRWQNWNMLGVLNMHKSINNLPLAQHCFIQALNLERKSFTTWTNLGVLYLKLHEVKLANQAFQRAQQSSPIYPNAWIGQAMIAETISEDEEAMDLFRHCQQFVYHPESALGYAHWVCTVLTNPVMCAQPHYKHAIEHMYADIVALDAINWYVQNEELEAEVSALTFQAFLNARQKLYRPAVKACLQATKIASPGEVCDTLYTSLGYLYLKLNEPEQAINAFNMVTHATFKPIIGLAWAYYRSGQLQESYSVYNSVLNTIAAKEGDKAADILVAMASMIYDIQGEADTKTTLYQSILMKEAPVQAMYSACALGILHQDNQLTETILTELKRFAHIEKHCTDIAYLTAQYHVTNNEPQKALCFILSSVRKFPNCINLRKMLANFLLENYSNNVKYQLPTSQIALSVLTLSHRNLKNICDPELNAETLLIASHALKSVDVRLANIFIQRAMHLLPMKRHIWKPLLKAVTA